jgi:AAA family ATP:ADP antiporter
MFFLTTFVYHVLRNMKVSLIVTLKGAGANVIPFLKICCVLPSAILVTYIFTKLVTKFNREQVFYYMMCSFIIYFIIFAFVLYPYQEFFELEKFSLFLKNYIFTASGFNGLIAVVKYWNIAFFYIVAELWSTFILTVLLWGFINEITEMNDAKRFYPIFNMGVNGSGILMGVFASWLLSLNLPVLSSYDSGNIWVFYQLILISLIACMILWIFFYLNRSIIKVRSSSQQRDKLAISFTECLYFIKHSKFLVFLVLIILSYNIIFNLADVVWVHRVKLLYANSKDYYNFMNKVTLSTAIIATSMDGLISGLIIRRYGWKISALLTPFIWLLTGIFFYSGILFEDVLYTDIIVNFISNPGNLILIIGTIQIILGRSFKYTIFDATKEMVFIPLTKKEKRKSKAVVDGIGTRLGKSVGSTYFIVLLIIFGDITSIIPYVVFLIIFLVLVWGLSVVSLNKILAKLNEPYSDSKI